MDLAPVRESRDFRFLLASRTVTFLGTIAADVALLVQAKQLTGSTVAVSLLGVAELVPVLLFGLYGGVLADRLDRKRMICWCEAGLGCGSALLVVNASLPRPALWPLYALAAGMTALAALQRPSLDAPPSMRRRLWACCSPPRQSGRWLRPLPAAGPGACAVMAGPSRWQRVAGGWRSRDSGLLPMSASP
jgi:MFS family permease